MNVVRLFCLFLPAMLLLACGADSELPPQRPVGNISGKVVDASLSNARVTLYAYGKGSRGRRLGGTITDVDGNFSLGIQAASQVILIESSGGSYVEQASGTSVTVPDSQVLQALVYYENGEPAETMVTPLTHLAAGLAIYKMNQGISATQAYDEAKTTIDQFFTIDTTHAVPIDITTDGTSINAPSSEALYGFYLAGISNWSLWASNKNRVAPHTTYTSMGVAQIMYNDIQADGMLDGVGYDLAHQQLMPLAIGVVPLQATTYRALFSLHVLAIANSVENTTNLKPGNLQPVAQDLATKPSDLFPAPAILDINSQAPEISLTQPLKAAYSGTLSIPIDIGGFLDAATVSLTLDGTALGELADPKNPELSIDTRSYPPDGTHEINLSATDILGNSATTTLSINFDNTNPVVNITSPSVTNQASTILSGTFSDNLAGVESIIINGQPAALDAANTWSAPVSLVPGENQLPMTVLDFAGNQLDTQASVFLDIIAPVIDTSNGHSNAHFADGSGGYFTAPLQDTNPSTPLYIETSHLSLNGVPIARAELDNNQIPYFAFSVSDEKSTANPTAFADLQVRIQYEKNGEILSPWHVLPVPASGTEYIIPLASETLAPQWHQASPLEAHNILLEVSDPAGNVTASNFYFRTDFYVPPLDISGMSVSDLGTDIFAATAFIDRASLDNRTFDSTAFASVVNPVNTAIYIRPDDVATHSVEQIVEQLVRVHQVRLITSTEWRLQLMDTTFNCPADSAGSWLNVTSLFNWNGNRWEPVSVPAPAPSPTVEYAPDDNLPPAPAATPWSTAPPIDNQYNSASSTSGGITLSYNFDYVVNNMAFLPPAAAVFNWQTKRPNGTPIATCPDTNLFQQRELFAYRSEPGYPKAEVSDVSLSGLPGFSSSGFSVFDNNAEALIQPVNGWYRVPAGHSVTVTKRVTTPALVYYNDDISNPDLATYTPRYYDRTIRWLVNRAIDISVIHDAGEANIPNLSQTSNSLGNGIMTYQVTR